MVLLDLSTLEYVTEYQRLPGFGRNTASGVKIKGRLMRDIRYYEDILS